MGAGWWAALSPVCAPMKVTVQSSSSAVDVCLSDCLLTASVPAFLFPGTKVALGYKMVQLLSLHIRQSIDQAVCLHPACGEAAHPPGVQTVN